MICDPPLPRWLRPYASRFPSRRVNLCTQERAAAPSCEEQQRGAQSTSASKMGQQRSSPNQLPPAASAAATMATVVSRVFSKASREDRAPRKRKSPGSRSGVEYVFQSTPHHVGVANTVGLPWTV
ncbi:hypothetical protein PAL_GLEAN10011592 [Pteropus alecto]|uniref:Uncharacterized protein n=1 Tax=Pteropus alecto TaxID=9402 RepID=L5KJI1_PTEAL|nr:hypothetical protein PAL_GLEAN10011592 [Pteropus alecto]